jgi:hypothetical protein
MSLLDGTWKWVAFLSNGVDGICLETTWISQSPSIDEFRAHFPCVGKLEEVTR